MNAFDSQDSIKDTGRLHALDLQEDHPDINYRCNIRMNFLINQHRTMIRQNQFVDAKAGALLAVIGIFAFRGPVNLGGLSMTDPVDVAYLVTVCTAIVFSVSAIFPRFPGRAQREEMAKVETWSWPALSALPPNDGIFYGMPSVTDLEHLFRSLSKSNAALARIILKKFQMLRMAFLISLIGLGIVVLKVAGIA
jgi:hypothetical protein